MLINDLSAYSKGNIGKAIWTLCFNPCFHSVALYRISRLFYIIKLIPIAKIVWYINRVLFCIDIDYRAKIGKGFMIIHGLGIVIGKGVVIGENVKIYQGVTIGGSGRSKRIGEKEIWQPHIGNNVTIYTNALIFGPITISDGKIIKASSMIRGDI